MAHLEIAHLLTSSCGKANSVVTAESVVETGQEPMARSPSFSQWLRTSILGHLAESKADFELEESPIGLEESLDLLDEEIVDAQALQEPLQKIDLGNPDEFGADGPQVTILPLESSDLGTDEPQQATILLLESNDLGTDEPQQATVLPLESSDLGTDQPQVAVSTPGLKRYAPISMSGLEETGIVSTSGLGMEKLPIDGNELKEPIALLANNKKDQQKALDKEPLDEMPWAGFSLFMESRAALQDVSFPRKDSTTASMVDKADEDKSMGITHHPKISQPESGPVDSLAQRKESKPVLGIMTPLVKNMRGESNAPGLKTKQLSDDGNLERPERKSPLKLPVTPIGRIVSNTPTASIRSAVPATLDASTAPPAEVPASPGMPALPATPPVSVAPAPLSASVPPATPPVLVVPAPLNASVPLATPPVSAIETALSAGPAQLSP
ncbi:MAG: hypothetical protein KDJ28_14770, partial [Candidatus Competibacteraceae bacterium]|nr:hypothetical protein [Candidatus Competibacteraceae bacterium]